jgi:hypothetical protein
MQHEFPSNSPAESFLWSEWRTDVDGYSVFGYKKIHVMRGHAYGKTEALIRQHQGIWNRTVLLEEPHRSRDRKHDCSYTASFLSLQVPEETADRTAAIGPNEFEVKFSIKQHDCVCGCQIAGGSSFQVFSRIGVFLPQRISFSGTDSSATSGYYQLFESIISRCTVEDHFTNLYSVRCGFHVASFSAYDLTQAMYCLNTSFVVDYEHFDAFSELRLPHMDMLRIRVPIAFSREKAVFPHRAGRQSPLPGRRYKFVQLPTDTYHNYVTCFVSSKYGRNLRALGVDRENPAATLSADNGNVEAEGTLESNGVVALSAGYSTYGVWRERFASWDAYSSNALVPSTLSSALEHMFSMHREFNERRSRIRAVNPADGYYCGDTSLTDISKSSPQARKVGVSVPFDELHVIHALGRSPESSRGSDSFNHNLNAVHNTHTTSYSVSRLLEMNGFNNNRTRRDAVTDYFTFDRERMFSKWTGLGNKFLSNLQVLSKASIETNFTNQTNSEATTQLRQSTLVIDLVLSGESHMRYLWDYVARVYFAHKGDFSFMAQKHNDVRFFRELDFRHRLFIPTACLSLKKINSETIKSPNADDSNVDAAADTAGMAVNATRIKAVVMQFGAWDIDTFPVRGTMDNPDRGLLQFLSVLNDTISDRTQAVHQEIKSAVAGQTGADTLSSAVHVQSLHLIIVNLFPHFPKIYSNATGGWKNNFAINAVNQKLFQMLLKLLVPLQRKQLEQLEQLNHSRGGTGPLKSDSHLVNISRMLSNRYSAHKLLTSFAFPFSKLKVTLVNAFEMMANNNEFASGVCGDHSLCHIGNNDESEGGYTRLQAGLVGMNIIMQAVYDGNDDFSVPEVYVQSLKDTSLGGVDVGLSSNTQTATVDSNYDVDLVISQERMNALLYEEKSTEFSELSVICITPSDGENSADADVYNECYLIINGLKQLIPDQKTLFYMIRNRMENCLSQTQLIPTVPDAIDEADKTDDDNNLRSGSVDVMVEEYSSQYSSNMSAQKQALLNHASMICDRRVGFQAIIRSKTRSDIADIASVYTMYSAMPPFANTSSSLCVQAINDADHRDGHYGTLYIFI